MLELRKLFVCLLQIPCTSPPLPYILDVDNKEKRCSSVQAPEYTFRLQGDTKGFLLEYFDKMHRPELSSLYMMIAVIQGYLSVL
jgi:hypothetical protein